MKKKVVYIICGVFIVAALIAMLVFIFSDGANNSSDENKSLNIVGTWKVAAVVENGIPVFNDQEFMLFTETEASNYRDGDSNPFASSTYKISGDDKLVLPDISREYRIDKKTDNYLRLYENAEKYLILIRQSDLNTSDAAVNKEMLIGKWNVSYRVTDKKIDEILEFTDGGTLNDYRNGSTNPVSSASYSWQEGNLIAEEWNKNMEVYCILDKTLILIETDTGHVWELEKIE